jgi:ectoine hydroxylase-related dioxygenase (phytanoyl-CoA dioxygenase family)
VTAGPWTEAEVRSFWNDGFRLVPPCFTEDEISVLRSEAHRMARESARGRVYELDGRSPRAIHGSHQENDVFARLVRLPRLLDVATQVIGSPVNVLQFKINFKAARSGERWAWHQDYIYFHNEDGLPAPRFYSVIIFLDPCTPENGPVLLLPGTSRYGMIPVKPPAPLPAAHELSDQPEWVRNFSVAGKFNLGDEVVAKMIEEHGVVPATGPAGSCLYIDGNIVHGSAENRSPDPRCVVIITYNSVENALAPRGKSRPEFLVSQDRAPLTRLDTDRLIA